MAKTKGTKHHVNIQLADLNKMFKDSDIIPVPKRFVRDIEHLLSAHSVSLADIKANSETAPAESEPKEEAPTVSVTEVKFED
jgi:hypothetical protein